MIDCTTMHEALTSRSDPVHTDWNPRALACTPPSSVHRDVKSTVKGVPR